MKLQLDTTKKTIKIEEDVKLSKLIDVLKKLLPNNEWKEFTLETNTTITYWTNPIVIERCPRRFDWGQEPWYKTFCDTKERGSNLELKSNTTDNKIFNFEIK